jgi:hypothetical protein
MGGEVAPAVRQILLPRLGVAGEQDLRTLATELSLVSLKSSPGGGAMTSVFFLGHPPLFHAPHLARPP